MCGFSSLQAKYNRNTQLGYFFPNQTFSLISNTTRHRKWCKIIFRLIDPWFYHHIFHFWFSFANILNASRISFYFFQNKERYVLINKNWILECSDKIIFALNSLCFFVLGKTIKYRRHISKKLQCSQFKCVFLPAGTKVIQ